MLIGRTVRWSASLRGELAEQRIPAEDLRLPPLTDVRHAILAAARDRFAGSDLYDLAYPESIRPSGSLDDDELATWLRPPPVDPVGRELLR